MRIPEFFGSLKNLQYLKLSNAGFCGMIPPTLGKLSNLQYLDVESSSLYVKSLEWVIGLVSLKHLSMNTVDRTDWFGALNHLPYLTELHLRLSYLSVYIPTPTSLNFTFLAVIDLSQNSSESNILDRLFDITSLSLKYIDIGYNKLSGRVPLGFSELPNLMSLTLTGNFLTTSCSKLFRRGWEKIHVLDYQVTICRENFLLLEI